jgi:hypothetical protein
MPLLRVSVDGTQVAAVSTEGLDVLTVNLGGTKIDEEFASLEFSGGRYPAEGESTHLIWLNGLVVHPGQRVRVELAASGSSSHAGKTIAELFPDDSEDDEDSEEPQDSPLSRDAVVDGVVARPQVRTAYHCDLESSSGAKCAASTSAQEHGFGISFLWNSLRAERVSASLHTYSLEQLRTHGESTYHWREHLVAGDWVEMKIEG